MSEIEIPDTPGDFFINVVPQQFANIAEGVEAGPGAICFEIVGHGLWSLEIANGELKVTEERHPDTIVHITFDGANWQQAAKQMSEGQSGPMSAQGLGNIVSNPAIATTLKAAQGTLKLVTKGDDSDEWVAITFGGAEPNIDAPRAQLSMSSEVAQQMSEGKANPQELFMSGKIQITGDMMMLMQLAPIMS